MESSMESAAPEDQTPEARGVALMPLVTPLPVLAGKHQPAPGDEIGESLAHWKRLLYVALGRWPFGVADSERRFGSVAVPAHFASALAEMLASAGYATRLSDAYSEEARMLTWWRTA